MRDTWPKRIILFLACWFGINILAGMIGGAYAGSQAASGISDPDEAYNIGKAAGVEFAAAYGTTVNLASFALAAIIAFPWQLSTILLIAGGIIYSGWGNKPSRGAVKKESASSEQQRSTGAAVSTPAAGNVVRLKEPITVKIAYGQVVIPAGTQASVLASDGETFRLKTAAGQEFTAGRSQLQLD